MDFELLKLPMNLCGVIWEFKTSFDLVYPNSQGDEKIAMYHSVTIMIE